MRNKIIFLLLFVAALAQGQVLQSDVVGKGSGVIASGSNPNFTVTTNFISQQGYTASELVTEVGVGDMQVIVFYLGDPLALDITAASIVSGSQVSLTVVNNTGVSMAFFPSADLTITKRNNNLLYVDSNSSTAGKAAAFNHNIKILSGAAGGGTTADLITLNPAFDIDGDAVNETTAQGAFEALRVYGSFEDDADAATNSVPVGGFYILSVPNTAGQRAGTVVQRQL